MIALVLLAVVTAFGFQAGSAHAAETTPFAWIQLVGGGVEARAATSLGHCPFMTVDGRLAPMQATHAGRRPLPPHNLPAETAARRARGSSLGRNATAPAPTAAQRILVFGDTRLPGEGGPDPGIATIPRRWPFAQVVRLAAARHPDLVIHVGDYYYRETPCPPGERACAGSPFGDKWPTWRAEFFDPARPLLNAAPWVFARGNHESCSRGGRGWFRLLDAGPAPLACPATSPTFKVDLGDLNLYLVDSADAADRDPNASAGGALRPPS